MPELKYVGPSERDSFTVSHQTTLTLHGTTIDLDDLIDQATEARQQMDDEAGAQRSPQAVMRVQYSPAYPGEVGSRDQVILIFEEA